MYIPAAFKDNDTPSLHQQMEQTRLAILVTDGAEGLQATHLPLLLRRDEGPRGTLYGHLAKANAQWQQLSSGAEALVVFPAAMPTSARRSTQARQSTARSYPHGIMWPCMPMGRPRFLPTSRTCINCWLT